MIRITIAPDQRADETRRLPGRIPAHRLSDVARRDRAGDAEQVVRMMPILSRPGFKNRASKPTTKPIRMM